MIEAFVPVTLGGRTSQVELRRLSAERVVLSVHRADPTSQLAEGSYIELSESGGVRLRPWSVRYSTPVELDEMAGAVGLTLDSRPRGLGGDPVRRALGASRVGLSPPRVNQSFQLCRDVHVFALRSSYPGAQ